MHWGCSIVLVDLVCLAIVTGAATLPLEREWDYYVRRVSNEVDALRRAEFASTNAMWTRQIGDRIAAAERSLRINAAFVEMLSECATEWRDSHDAFDPEDGEYEGDDCSAGLPCVPGGDLQFESTSVDWDMCDGQAAGYTSIDELFAHLYRDFDRLRERRHQEATLRLIAGAVEQRGFGSSSTPSSRRDVEVLVLGAGVCGLVHAVAQLPGVRVTATECSPVFMHGCRCALFRSRNTTLVPWLGLFGSAMYGTERDQFSVSTIEFPGLSQSAVVKLVQADALVSRPVDTVHQFDVVVTSYFVDAAISSSVSVFHVLTRIAQLVKPQGFWVNCGPLQYHKVDVLPKLSVWDMVTYVTHGQNYFEPPANEERSVDILEPEEYSRSSNTSLTVNSFRAALFQLRRR